MGKTEPLQKLLSSLWNCDKKGLKAFTAHQKVSVSLGLRNCNERLLFWWFAPGPGVLLTNFFVFFRLQRVLHFSPRFRITNRLPRLPYYVCKPKFWFWRDNEALRVPKIEPGVNNAHHFESYDVNDLHDFLTHFFIISETNFHSLRFILIIRSFNKI